MTQRISICSDAWSLGMIPSGIRPATFQNILEDIEERLDSHWAIQNVKCRVLDHGLIIPSLQGSIDIAPQGNDMEIDSRRIASCRIDKSFSTTVGAMAVVWKQ